MKSKVLFFLLVTASITSCLHMENIPYAITEPECKIGKVDGFHEFAGIHFVFYNNTEKHVTGFRFSCVVFDSDGESSPLIGSNVISARSLETISAHEGENIIFSLDPYISEIPTEAYVIDFFYVTKIEYSDGSVWDDPYGSWIAGGL